MSDIAIKPPLDVAGWVEKEGGYLEILDQTKLPESCEYIRCDNIKDVWNAIRRLAVRGAPAIGIAAAYGMVIAANQAPKDGFYDFLEDCGDYLKTSRPTAVNLQWAVERILNFAKQRLDQGADIEKLREEIFQEAWEIHFEDQRLCMAIGHNSAGIIRGVSGVLTHCNAGALATGGIGTATAGMYVAHASGHEFTVYCDETRPLLQGSRLTAWELMQAGIDATVITDSMAGVLMREGRVQLVITGADRIARNGDTANKIGTYSLAVLAKYHEIPFYVAAPYSTFDLELPDGAGIPIEQRDGDEIIKGFARLTGPENVNTFNPAFDVTPAELITAIITDKGVISPVTEANISKCLS